MNSTFNKEFGLGIGMVTVQRKKGKIINGFWWLWDFDSKARKKM